MKIREEAANVYRNTLKDPKKAIAEELFNKLQENPAGLKQNRNIASQYCRCKKVLRST